MMQGNSIRAIRRSRGLTLEEVGKLVGVSAGQVSRWETKGVDIPKSRLMTLAMALECSVDELLSGSAVNHTIDQVSELRIPDRRDVKEQIPIFDTWYVGKREFDGVEVEIISMEINNVGEYIHRPVALSRRADIYGLFVRGYSMAPAYQEGDLILAESFRPARRGDDVIVRLAIQEDDASKNGKIAFLLKRLVERTADHVELEQHYPPAKFRVPEAEVLSVDRLLRLGDTLVVSIP